MVITLTSVLSDGFRPIEWPENYDRTDPSDREPYPHNVRLTWSRSVENIRLDVDNDPPTCVVRQDDQVAVKRALPNLCGSREKLDCVERTKGNIK